MVSACFKAEMSVELLEDMVNDCMSFDESIDVPGSTWMWMGRGEASRPTTLLLSFTTRLKGLLPGR